MGNAHRVTFLLTPLFMVISKNGNAKGNDSLLHDQLRSQLREKQGRKPQSPVAIALFSISQNYRKEGSRLRF